MKPGLLAFIFFSAVAHAALLVNFDSPEFNINEHKEPGNISLELELTAQQPTIKKQASQPPALNTISHKQLTAVHSKNTVNKKTTTSPQKNTAPVIPEKTPAPVPAEKPAREISTADNSKQINQEQVTTLLKTEFTKYFYYPKAARRRNYQGDLILSFIINDLGNIENIRVQESSGYKILDDAAIESIRKIKLNTQLKNILTSSTTVQKLPVSYALVN